MSRLFVAVWPPEEVLEVVAALPRPEERGVRWSRPDQWHVTLRFLGEVEDVGEAVTAVDAVSASSVTATMGPVTEVLGRTILVAPVAGIEAVAEAVISATAEVGRSPETRPFNGHLTLARGKRPGPVRRLAGEPCAASWTVDEVVLVESHLGSESARYEDVARVALSLP
jgi:2'-5' RNA ligase